MCPGDSQRNGFGQHLVPQRFATGCRCADVYGHAEESLHLGAEERQLEGPRARLELDQEVEVTPFSGDISWTRPNVFADRSYRRVV